MFKFHLITQFLSDNVCNCIFSQLVFNQLHLVLFGIYLFPSSLILFLYIYFVDCVRIFSFYFSSLGSFLRFLAFAKVLHWNLFFFSCHFILSSSKSGKLLNNSCRPRRRLFSAFSIRN